MINVPLKYMASVTLGKMLQSSAELPGQKTRSYLKASSITDSGLATDNLQVMPFSESEMRSLSLLRDDVVVVEGGSIGRSAWLPHDLQGVHFQNSINRVRPNKDSDGRYLNYVIIMRLQTGYFEAVTNQATIRHLTADKLAQTPVPLTSLRQQRRIADYLDHETAEIDAFIDGLAVASELRGERWRATRDRYLAFGIDGQGLRRPATWFYEQCAKWAEGPIKRQFSVTLGKMLDEKQHQNSAERHPYLRAGNIGDGSIDFDDMKSMPFDLQEQRKFSLEKNDILVVEGGSVGTNAVLNIDAPGIYFQKTVNRMRPDPGVSSGYYSEVLNSYRDRGVFDVVANKSTIQHLTAEKLANLEVPIPSINEQHEISDLLQKSRLELSSIRVEVNRAVDLARERRAALITAAVTGQIDVTARNKPAAEQLEDDIAQGLHKESQ